MGPRFALTPGRARSLSATIRDRRTEPLHDPLDGLPGRGATDERVHGDPLLELEGRAVAASARRVLLDDLRGGAPVGPENLKLAVIERLLALRSRRPGPFARD